MPRTYTSLTLEDAKEMLNEAAAANGIGTNPLYPVIIDF
jgi:hypothetical protein